MLVDVSQRQNAITAIISGTTDKAITIGRGRNSSLRVTDITVSREHASIQRIGDEYYIKDCKSKFGTLVRSSEKEI
jgi:pSer/pThr/pTyr-binding forkhead associated (FHA) protein